MGAAGGARWLPSARPFREGQPPLYQLGRIRWYLHSGWGSGAHKRAGPVRLHGERAKLLVPSLTPEALEVSVRLDAPKAMRLEASVNGRPLEPLLVGPEPSTTRLRIPPELLFRGDNVLGLAMPDRGDPAPRLHGFAFRRVLAVQLILYFFWNEGRFQLDRLVLLPGADLIRRVEDV